MSAISVQNNGQSVQIRVPMKLKRRNGRKVVILPEGATLENVAPRLSAAGLYCSSGGRVMCSTCGRVMCPTCGRVVCSTHGRLMCPTYNCV